MKTLRRQFRRWILSSIDLDQAISWADIILDNHLYEERDNKPRNTGRGLQTAMVIAYSRPFSVNYDRDHTIGKLNDEFLKVFDNDERVFHGRMKRTMDSQKNSSAVNKASPFKI